MNVKGLIQDLLECEMEFSIVAVINGEEFDIRVEDLPRYAETHLIVQDISDKVLVDKDEFEEMKSRIDELEAELEDLRNK